MNDARDDCGWIGLDIGGANIKVAIDSKAVCSIPFPLWKQLSQLCAQLSELLRQSPGTVPLAVTMTGELVDCFPNREAGVRSIVAAVEQAAGERVVKFYGTPPCQKLSSGNAIQSKFLPAGDSSCVWHDAETAITSWIQVAAANWHAIANFSARYLPAGDGFLIDVGSTTTDIIPIRAGRVAAQGQTDFERLRFRELFYAGVRRTPLCSLCDVFQMRGQTIAVAREFFATMEDAFLLTGDMAEEPQRIDTADGRPATWNFAAQRMARMICRDATMNANRAAEHNNVSINAFAEPAELPLTEIEIVDLARQSIAAVSNGISHALQQVIAAHKDLPRRFIISGQGDWFANRIVKQQFGTEAETILLAERVGQKCSQSAGAYAVARLATEAFGSANDLVRIGKKIAVPENRNRAISHRIIKLGGSLLDWDQAPIQIQRWLALQPPLPNVWIVGGGQLANVVRQWQRSFPLAEKTAHWICIDLMSVNARMVQQWFPDWPICTRVPVDGAQASPANVLLDIAGWFRELPALENGPAETWDVTSDSCAAFVAGHVSADELVLLKSCSVAKFENVDSLADAGIVDRVFSATVTRVPQIRLVNLRDAHFETTSIQPPQLPIQSVR